MMAPRVFLMAFAAELAALLTARKSEGAVAGGGFASGAGFEGSGGKSVAEAGGAFGSGAGFGGGAAFSTSTAHIGTLLSRIGATSLTAGYCNPSSARLLSTAPCVEESGPLKRTRSYGAALRSCLFHGAFIIVAPASIMSMMSWSKTWANM